MTASTEESSLPRRLARALAARRPAVLAVAVLIALAGLVLASRLKVRGDFAALLPPSTRAVQDLHALEKRAQVFATVLVAVESDDPVARAAAATALRDKITALPDGLQVTFDDAPGRRFAWDNRFLFAPLADLEKARDALAEKVSAAKLKANPLYVSFEDEEDDEAPAEAAPKLDAELSDLRAKLAEAKAKVDKPTAMVSKDGRLQLLVVRTPYTSGDVPRNKPIVAAIERVIHEVQTPAVTIGLTGDAVTAIAEHRSILEGMTIATVLTVVVVGFGLLFYYRTAFGVLALLGALAVGTLATFGFTNLAIGHLNLATAFLGAIVMGNGINFGMVLLARHLEERQAGRDWRQAATEAVAGTWQGTFAAALTASVAYASLIATDFRGFRDFGLIAGVGILLCWLAMYTVLPALLGLLDQHGKVYIASSPAPGGWMAHLVPARRSSQTAVLLAAVVTTLVAGVTAYRFLSETPFETNFKKLRSESSATLEARAWTTKIDAAFGRGISGGFVIAVPDRARTGEVLATLRAVSKPDDPARLLGRTASLDDLLPADQAAKLPVLAELRRLLEDSTVIAEAEDQGVDLAELRPPAELRPLVDADVPRELAWPFIEKDGTRGKLIVASVGPSFDPWKTEDLGRFVAAFRALPLGDGVLVGGSTFVLDDISRSVGRDGPRATLIAAAGAVVVVLLMLGFSLHSLVTLFCSAAGTLLMLSAASLIGLRVNFLDFVALPITIGIGVDYCTNIVVRYRQEGPDGLRRSLVTTGAAVAMCSYTTVVGYASLLFSDNQGIRSFGTAAILGEVMSLVAAMVFAPALLVAVTRRAHR